MDGEMKMVLMLYLIDQSPSAAVRLMVIRYNFISGVFELFICAIVTSHRAIGPGLVSPVIAGRMLACVVAEDR